MTEATAIKYVGQPLRRREDFKFVTGKGRYTDDIKAPGMLHMAVLRSPHAHAVIRQVDLSAASAAPGVRLALSGAELAGKIGAIVPNWIIPGTKVPDRPVVAIDRVRFVGECVALVVAETQAMAHDAIGLDRGRLRNPSRRDRRGSRDPRRRTATARQRARQHHHGLQDRRRRLRKGRAAKPIRSFASRRQQSPDPDLHGDALDSG